MTAGQPRLILASGSVRRLALLEQVGVSPDSLRPVDIDETQQRRELPRVLARRLAREKAEAARIATAKEGGLDNTLILAADTVVSMGRRVIPKPDLLEDAADGLRQLSGRSHRVYTGVCLIDGKGRMRERIVDTRVRFKHLSREEIESYLASGEWRGKAGGYAIQGLAGAFVVRVIGSYTSVVGLPLHETVNMLVGAGYRVHYNWLLGAHGDEDESGATAATDPAGDAAPDAEAESGELAEADDVDKQEAEVVDEDAEGQGEADADRAGEPDSAEPKARRPAPAEP